jgi:hypothetical protein
MYARATGKTAPCPTNLPIVFWYKYKLVRAVRVVPRDEGNGFPSQLVFSPQQLVFSHSHNLSIQCRHQSAEGTMEWFQTVGCPTMLMKEIMVSALALAVLGMVDDTD